MIFLLIIFFYLLELVSFKELYFFDESDNNGSGFGSAGTFAFPFSSVKSVCSAGEYIGSVSGVVSGSFVLIAIESVGDVVPLVMFVQRGVGSKGG